MLWVLMPVRFNLPAILDRIGRFQIQSSLTRVLCPRNEGASSARLMTSVGTIEAKPALSSATRRRVEPFSLSHRLLFYPSSSSRRAPTACQKGRRYHQATAKNRRD